MQWDFVQDEQGKWFWRCYQGDRTYSRSQHTFDTRVDCIADAMRHGYLALELTRFRGHLILGKEGDHDAEVTRAVPI